MSVRFAIYFIPDTASPLWRFGSAVIGYDAASGEVVPALVPAGFTADAWSAATADPRLYGFHATLKAPFRTPDEVSEADIADELHAFAAPRAAFSLGGTAVSVVPAGDGGGFVAVTPREQPAAVSALEQELVTRFDRFRAPLTEAERARRRPERLSQRQREQLDRFGYPYIFEDFQFHMTLTGGLDAPEPVAAALGEAAARAGVGDDILVDRIALFRQDGAEGRFRIVATALFGA